MQFHRTIRSLTITALFGIAPLSVELLAQSVHVYPSNHDREKTRTEILRVMEQIDGRGYEEPGETGGFSFLLESRFRSPYTYNILGGPISISNPTFLVRLEGGAGDVRIFEKIFNDENIINLNRSEPGVKLSSKSHILAQTINLAAPWLGVLYSSYNSPRLTRKQTWNRFFTYFFLDLAIAYAAGSNFFREPFKGGKYGDEIAAGLALLRLYGMYDQINLIRGHNRLAEMKYTFYLD